MERPKVLVFSIADFRLEHGGILLTKTILEILSRMKDMRFIVAFSGPEDAREASERFVETLGLEYTFVPFKRVSAGGDESPDLRVVSGLQAAFNVIVEKFYFWGERRWRQQGHIGGRVLDIIRESRPDILIINGMFSAFYIRSVFQSGIPCCLITQDNDVPFYRALKARGGRESMGSLELWLFRHGNWIPDIRVRRFIYWIYRRCAGVVTLTENDMPSDLPDHIQRAVMPPVLPMKELRWSYRGTRSVFFVGSIFAGDAIHFANWAAIEWMSLRLAPKLARIDRSIRIIVIGARPDQVPESWRHPRIDFLGRSDRDQVVRHLTTTDLCISPIATNYGAKMKLAECVSYGTPFLATLAAMSGLPFLKGIPVVELDQPGVAAELISNYIQSPQALRDLSRQIVSCGQQAHGEQDVAWHSLVKGFLRKSPERREAIE